MTNKPMLSVERELLEALHSHPDCPVEFIDHLRRAISQPAGNAFKRCTILKECSTSASATTAAAQQQGKPVAYTTAGMLEIAKRLPLTGRIGAKATKDERWNIPLFLGQAEQPAPVAVVLPGRKVDPHRHQRLITPGCGVEKGTAEGWNACLEEVARLNGVKP